MGLRASMCDNLPLIVINKQVLNYHIILGDNLTLMKDILKAKKANFFFFCWEMNKTHHTVHVIYCRISEKF